MKKQSKYINMPDISEEELDKKVKLAIVKREVRIATAPMRWRKEEKERLH